MKQKTFQFTDKMKMPVENGIVHLRSISVLLNDCLFLKSHYYQRASWYTDLAVYLQFSSVAWPLGVVVRFYFPVNPLLTPLRLYGKVSSFFAIYVLLSIP